MTKYVKKKKCFILLISKDEGKSWTTTPAPELIDPGCNASIIRYTSIKDGYKKNEFTSFSLAWLTDGKDSYKKPK